MDSPEDANSLQCENFLECSKSKPSVSDASIQLDLIEDAKSESEDSEHGIHEDLEEDLSMKLPVTIQNCVPAGVQVSSELLVITNTAGFLNDPKIPLSSLHTVDNTESMSKRICLEQDGQTYILALQDGMDCLNGVMELRPKNLSTVEAAQILSNQDVSTLPSKHGINQNWFTSREEKTTLHSKGHLWKQGMWAKEEIELLEGNIRQYCEEHDISDPATIIFEMSKDERKDFYRTIAKGLNRPLFSVYRRVIRMYDNKNHVGKYTPEELERLKKLRSVYGNDWQAIGAAMGRSASSIKDRCRLMKDNCNQGKWLPAEERRLAEAVYEMANALPGEMISTGLSWAMVAERVGTRSEKQCRTKWLNYLNWKEAGGTDWTREDDVTLVCRVYALSATDENQIDWSELAKGWSSVRSPQWLRGKWWSLKRHAPNANLASFPEICEFLYQHFVLKIKVKEEACGSLAMETPTEATALQASQLLARPKPTILRSVGLSATPPPPTGIMVTAATQACTGPVVSLTGATDLDVVTTPSSMSSVRVGPVLQTLEVLPQSIQLATNQQTFLLATHPQPGIPLTTSLSPNQIIIQAVPTENLQRNENVTVQMNTQIVINASNPATLTSLASTQIPSAPPSPSDIDADPLDDAHSSLIEERTYESEAIEDNENIHRVSEINSPEQVENPCQANSTSHFILSDPMLAATRSPEIGVSDVESEKIHVCNDSLDHVSMSNG